MKVSICTSVLNQSDYLTKMVQSVIAQTFKDWELIIVDDGSQEDIAALVGTFNDERIVYYRFPENRGIPHGLNYAFSLATGDYLQPLSADEFIWEKKLEVQVAWMDDHPGIGCTWGLPTPNVGQQWELGEKKSWEQFAAKAHNRSREAWIRTLLRLENIPIGGASMLMRRECYQDIGGFDPQFFDCSDLEWFVRFFGKYEGWILPYRLADAVHPETRLTGSTTSGRVERFQADLQKLHAKHKIVLPPTSGRVTVGIPVYNMAQFIPRALESLKAQTFQDFDIIVMDDASTDDLLPALRPYAGRINLQKFDENRGVRQAVNQMIAMCNTEFFVSLAADDWLEPTYLERALAEFKADPFLEFVASQTDFVDKDGKEIPPGTHDLQKIARASNKPRERWLHELYYGNQYFGVGMARTGVLKQIGGLDLDAGILCDYDLYLRLLQRENIKIMEENLTHTRVHDGMASYGNLDRLWLRNKYHEIKSRYYSPRMKVIIATPFYEMRGFSPYIVSLGATIQTLARAGVEMEYWEISGDSYVDRAKNTIFNKFLEDPAATHLFLIDSDMQWDVQGFVNMLMMPEDIVMGSYPQKNSWDLWTARPELTVPDEQGKCHPVGRMLPDGSALIKAAYLAGGFLRIKREVLEKYKEHYKDFVYHDPGADPACTDRLYTEFFTCERANADDGTPLRWGEDRVFGKRMAAIGVEGWIYPKVDMGHYGIKGWTGNYDTFLKTGAKTQ